MTENCGAHRYGRRWDTCTESEASAIARFFKSPTEPPTFLGTGAKQFKPALRLIN